MKLVVGLGNPGSQYVGTRHNIGFDVIDALAIWLGLATSENGFMNRARSKFDGLVLDGLYGGDKVLLLKPMTFMNLSGKSVQAVLAFYQVSPADLMVVLDDLALPCGKIRLRAGGSDGGHNGLKDIARAIGTSQYPRLRLGIDPPGQFVPQKDYVLGKFSGPQKQAINPAIDRAASAIVCWMQSGIELAMNRFNADSPSDNAASRSSRDN